MAKENTSIPKKKSVPTSVRLSTETYEQVKQYADENGTSFSETLHSVLEDAIGFFEPKIKELEKALDELKVREAEQTVNLNKIIDTLSTQISTVKNEHVNTKNNPLGLILTKEQIDSLEQFIQYRENTAYQEDDGYAKNPIGLMYFLLREYILGRNTIPLPKAKYKEIFPELEKQAKTFLIYEKPMIRKPSK